MSLRDQQKFLSALKRYEKKMEPKELEDYKMLVKRDKMEEDLDKLSMDRLKSYYEKYHLNRERKDYSNFFKDNEE
ncbi:MAG: hypothetical protein K8F60_05260 [Melioribacteraceae bacterium]|nr:hypothetical protein [Melioribacteraceae bacterium]